LLLLKIEKITDRIIDAVGYLTGVLMIWLIFNVAWDVLMRYVFHNSSIAMQELEWHTFAVIMLYGTGYALRHKRPRPGRNSLRPDLTPRRRRWITFLGNPSFSPFLGLLGGLPGVEFNGVPLWRFGPWDLLSRGHGESGKIAGGAPLPGDHPRGPDFLSALIFWIFGGPLKFPGSQFQPFSGLAPASLSGKRGLKDIREYFREPVLNIWDRENRGPQMGGHYAQGVLGRHTPQRGTQQRGVL